ncbi:MAG TPA: DUF4230 domain-containing protein [Acidimicrobiia bacterium]|nr:DUF4230 domain-containing protein [Acidimicrobiia bacterium]
MSVGQWEAHVALLDASTQPRIVRSGRSRGPTPPARRRPAATRPVTAPIPTHTGGPGATIADRPAPTRTRIHRPKPEPLPAPRRSRAWLGVLAGALAAGLVTGGTLAALGVAAPTSSHRGLTEATVRRAVQALGTVSSNPQPVSVTFTDNASSALPGFGDQVTYRAVGTDAATVELSTVGVADVALAGTHARVVIPAAQLGTAVLDPSQSGVVSHHEGLATHILGTGIATSDLENEAVGRLGEQAQSDGVPATAQRVGALDVVSVLHRLGITNVAVEYASS